MSFPLRDVILAFALKSKKGRSDLISLETSFARFIGVEHAIFVPSGRIALYLILKHAGLRPGDEVLLPAFTFFAVPQVIRALALKPVFVEVNPGNCGMNLSDAEERITSRSRAIIPTHLFGIGADLEGITSLARKHKLMVIEDCAQGCGAEKNGKKLGSFGEASYFSFSLTKNITCLGGGMIVTKSKELAEKIRNEVGGRPPIPMGSLVTNFIKILAMKTSTFPPVYNWMTFPIVSRLGRKGKDVINDLFREKEEVDLTTEKIDKSIKIPPNIQARIGIRQLKRVRGVNAGRLRNGTYLLRALEKRGAVLEWKPAENPGNIFMSFIVLATERQEARNELWEMGIDTSIGFMSFCPSFFAPQDAEQYPQAKRISESILHIPVYPSLKEKELELIAGAVGRALKDRTI